MKKFLLLIVACAALDGLSAMLNPQNSAACAQRVITNTVSPKDFSAYDRQNVDLTIYRYIHQGWNTVCLPVSLSEAELNDIFGSDCRLETLVGVETDGATTKLNFKDVKPDGLKAHTPYILYSTEPSGVREIKQNSVTIETGEAELNFTDNAGQSVSFAGASDKQNTEGMYGIMARDNQTATFVNASQVSVIYSTRCYIKLNGGELTQQLTTNHLPYEITAVEAATADLTADNEPVDVYNLMGTRVATGVAPSELARVLPKGVYVVKGKTFWNK
ncbi:MAG: hypothetical protein J1F13_03180 [Prevotellaceae bacterium]|nr:hypothetical protein [Prevotellaceae bacterium]